MLYICSWLLRYPNIKVRTSDPVFLGHVRQFFDQLLSQVVNLQFLEGGPIIAVQVCHQFYQCAPV
jgi:beta-galactosidase